MFHSLTIEKNHFKPLPPKKSKKDWHGYQKLFNANDLAKIQAYMLTDDSHPLITSGVLKEMNDNGLDDKISYDSLAYNLHIWIATDDARCPVK